MIAIHPHARQRMKQRGANEEEITQTVVKGERFPAKHGRTGFRRNFPGNWSRNGKRFDTKQLEVYAVQEDGGWLVITVIANISKVHAMRLTYDPKANAAYLKLRDYKGDVETLEITSDFLVDIDGSGTVCGIELLNANEQLRSGDEGRFIFENPLSGEISELKVA